MNPSTLLKLRRQGNALNKPLMILQALGNLLAGKERLLPFEEIEPIHKDALLLFSLQKKGSPASYAFWRLQNDKVWEITSASALVPRLSNTDPTSAELRRGKAFGGLCEKLFVDLQQDHPQLRSIVDSLLTRHFPSILHEKIRHYFGLGVEDTDEFKRQVHSAYGNSCAILQQNTMVAETVVGLSAAPIKRFEAGGPKSTSNGILLCEHLSHLFLVGGFTIIQQGNICRVLLSPQVRNVNKLVSQLYLHGGEPVNLPKNAADAPDSEFLSWHKRNIFIS